MRFTPSGRLVDANPQARVTDILYKMNDGRQYSVDCVEGTLSANGQVLEFPESHTGYAFQPVWFRRVRTEVNAYESGMLRPVADTPESFGIGFDGPRGRRVLLLRTDGRVQFEL